MNMNRSILLVIAAIVISTSGCALAPKYTKPGAPIPAGWPTGAAYKADKAESPAWAASELSRQEFFTDTKLQQIIDTALDNNRDLQLAALNVDRARAAYGIQRAEVFPSVNATGAGGKQRLSADLVKPGTSRTIEQYSVNMGIAGWEIDIFGRIRSLKDQALEEYLATDEARRGTQIALVSEVARVYLTLAADLENLKLSRSTLETQQEAHNLIRRQYEAGLANELDLRRAQIPVEAARGAVVRFMQMAALDQNALNLLAGSPVPPAGSSCTWNSP